MAINHYFIVSFEFNFTLRKRFRKVIVKNFYLQIQKSVLYLHSQYRNRLRYWRVGRVVECGSLENC